MNEERKPVIRAANYDDDFTLRYAMIPMRDGVELHTLILAPKDTAQARPILLSRTPYDASRRVPLKQRSGLRSVMGPGLAELDGYIFVMQDIRGQYGSGGVFELNRRRSVNAATSNYIPERSHSKECRHLSGLRNSIRHARFC